MIKHPIRKFLGLTVLYSVIILGIFLLQFRSETALSQSFAGLRLQLVETQSDSQQRLLKNTFQATYKGLNIFADDQSPVTITKADDTVQPVSLYSWKEIDASNFTLYFDQAIALHFSIKTDDTGDFLSIEAELPEDTKNIAISYKPTSGYLVTEQNTRRLIISSKQQQYEVSAAEITSSHLVLSDMEQFATYNTFDPLYGFEFSMVNALPLSAETTFVETISKFKTDFIQLASQSLSETSTEQMVVAYVAAMAENRQYREAINKIPSSLKTGSRRTFLSAPYFNSLTAMNPSLQRHMENRRSMIDYAIQQKSLDIFTIQDLAQVLCTMEGNGLVEELLAMPAGLADFNPSVAQAAGILDTYTQLVALNRNLSVGLQPILNNCLEIIAAACMLENNIIRLEENDAALPILDSISVGMSLISYGQLTGNIDYRATGNLIVNSYITPEVSSNLHIMTELYPIVVPNNPYYPHIQIIADASMSGNNTPVWAWTVARDTSYVRDSEGNVTITLDFPSGETHHAIINGIRPFRRIDIYDISFRTDPKFESYNSSGYVFDAETQTLLLKSLHKVQREAIKFYYAATPTEPEAPESQAPATTTTTTQTSPPAAEVPTSTESS
ncbi:MAG: hypothetical protein J6K76_07920 [Spirochaetaceae bacterium]|nr:hypothetical protein [Spirochaetaceae bacterium]